MKQLELKYNSQLHRVLLRAIKDRYQMSYDEMSKYHSRWTENEERFIAYRKESEGDARRRQSRSDGSPQFTTLEVPYSYAMLMTAQTYWTTVFLGRNPIFQYTGRHGEAEQSIMGLESLIDYQVTVGEMLVPLYIWSLDMGKYGLGIIYDYWDENEVVVSQIEERPVTYLGVPVPGKKPERVRTVKRIKGYAGNKLINIRPYDFFPDPRVPVKDFQKGEFCSHETEVGWNEILKGAASGKYQNIDVLKKLIRARNQREAEQGTSQKQYPGTDRNPDQFDPGFVTVLVMTIELVPKEWGLGSGSYPEKWVFTMADGEVLIEARPFGAYHGKFPYQVQQYEQDGYELIPRGMPEITEPLNNTLSWLINSHFHNVRKVLNDQLVYDPSRIVGKDLANPTSGRLIRLKPSAYGTDPRLAVHQLQTVDVTQNHLKDAQIITDMLQRATGVTDNIMGLVNQGGRKTATEVRTSSSFGTNRLKMHCEYASAMAWAPLSQMLVQNTQQYYDAEKQFRIVGDMMTSEKFIRVDPESIQGFYDYVPVDGTLPIDRYAMANLWRELMAQMANIPQLAMEYNIGSIFSYVAKLAGAKNIDQFKVNVVPDSFAEQQAQAGNLVPVGGNGGNGGRTTSTGGSEARVSEPGQVSGMGTTG